MVCELNLDDKLGAGSYGVVCKARWGQLPCAAKLLHGNCDPIKFEQECQFLSTIKHPNIIQYLGTITNPSGRQILLMELMDESLTEFLERLPDCPLPYHSQVSICHDIALALSYLHSNDIIHRDLSSNNILLIGEGSRAKVTDFGMSKLASIMPAPVVLPSAAPPSSLVPQQLTLTRYPGTPAYMPPEAASFYTAKLDCFSFGVLTIQLIIKKYPSPGTNRVLQYATNGQVLCAPNGQVQWSIVSEFERRKDHIVQIDSSHSLQPMALACLKDNYTERPSADDLCGKLASLKTELLYKQSLKQTKKLWEGLEAAIAPRHCNYLW